MVQRRRVDGSYQVGEVSRVKVGVGYYDGFVVAASMSETCYSANEKHLKVHNSRPW